MGCLISMRRCGERIVAVIRWISANLAKHSMARQTTITRGRPASSGWCISTPRYSALKYANPPASPRMQLMMMLQPLRCLTWQVRFLAKWINELFPFQLFLYVFFCHVLSEGFVWTVINPLTAKLFSLNFHPLEVVLRWRDPQLQVSENCSDLTKWRSTVFKYCWFMSHFIFNMFKRWYLMC